MTATWRVPLIVGLVLRGSGRAVGSLPDRHVHAGPFLKDIPKQDPPRLEARRCFQPPVASFCFSQSKTFRRSRKQRKDKKNHSQAVSRSFGRHCTSQQEPPTLEAVRIYHQPEAAATGLSEQPSSTGLAPPVADLASHSRSRGIGLT